MSIEEKKNAEKKFRDSGMSKNLIKFILETKHYSAWVKNSAEFEDRYNFGLKNITTEKVEIKISYSEKIDYLTVATYKDKRIKFGNGNYSFTFPDGEYSYYKVVQFYIDDKLIVHGEYLEISDDPIIASDYEFLSLEEFHYTSEFENLIKDMCKDIDEFIFKRRKLDIQKIEDSYKGKFTSED